MRALRGIVIALAVVALLLGGLYYADSRFHDQAEEQIAANLRSELGTPVAPDVSIKEWPFLTQVVAGSIGTVTVNAEDIVATNEAPLAIAHAFLELNDMSSSDRFQTMEVARASGTARLDYPALQSVAGVPLTYVGNGRVQIVVGGELVGRRIEATITGVPTLDAGAQTVNLEQPLVWIAGVELPDFTSQALVRTLLKPIPLGELPFGLQVRSMVCGDDGIHADITGENLTLTR